MSDISFRKPVNRLAGIVTSRGPDDRTNKHIREIASSNPIAIKSIPLNVKDRTGAVCGQLTCVGFYEYKPKRRNLWVCRCSCGNYVVRTGDSLNARSEHQCCPKCNETQYLKRQATYLQYGRNIGDTQ